MFRQLRVSELTASARSFLAAPDETTPERYEQVLGALLDIVLVLGDAPLVADRTAIAIWDRHERTAALARLADLLDPDERASVTVEHRNAADARAAYALQMSLRDRPGPTRR